IHLWELTGDPRLATRVAEIGQRLLDSAEGEGPHISWRTPRSAPSAFAGRRCHGFAHGTAGIGHFLDCAARLAGPAGVRPAAPRTVPRKWRSRDGYSHGLTGDALLPLACPTLRSGPTGGLDPAAVVGPYPTWAGDLLRLMWERRTTDEHGAGLTDEPGRIT